MTSLRGEVALPESSPERLGVYRGSMGRLEALEKLELGVILTSTLLLWYIAKSRQNRFAASYSEQAAQEHGLILIYC